MGSAAGLAVEGTCCGTVAVFDVSPGLGFCTGDTGRVGGGVATGVCAGDDAENAPIAPATTSPNIEFRKINLIANS